MLLWEIWETCSGKHSFILYSSYESDCTAVSLWVPPSWSIRAEFYLNFVSSTGSWGETGSVSFSTPLVKPAPRMTPGSAREPWCSKIISFQFRPELNPGITDTTCQCEVGFIRTGFCPDLELDLGAISNYPVICLFGASCFFLFLDHFLGTHKNSEKEQWTSTFWFCLTLFNSFHSVLLSYFTFVKNLPCASYHAFTYIAWFNHHVNFVLWIWITSSYRWISDTWTSE